MEDADLAKKRAAASARLRRKLPRYKATKAVLMAVAGLAMAGAVGMAGASLLSYANASPAGLALPGAGTIDQVGQNLGIVASCVGAAQWASSRVAMWEKRIHALRLTIKKLAANDPNWRVYYTKLKVLEGRTA